MPALSFVADVQDSSWGGRGSPGTRRSPCTPRRRRSSHLPIRQQQQQQQHPVHNKQRQHNARERSGTNENSPIRKEAIYRETHGFHRNHHQHNNHHQRNHQHQHIEVGSEILVPAGRCLTDDNVRQKLDSGAILVHGKEELPLGYDAAEDNNRKRRPYSAGHLFNHHHNGLENDDEEHRRLSDDELLRVRRLDGRRRRLRSAGSDHEDYANGTTQNIKNKNDEIRDKNANAHHHDATRSNNDITSARRQSATLPRRRRRRALSGSFAGNPLPPHRVTPDGTAIYYWCELPRRPGSQELDDGAYNPLWTMRGFTQTFHFWKETKRAQSVPLNAFLTYITLPWWSIAKDILDHREGPILTF